MTIKDKRINNDVMSLYTEFCILPSLHCTVLPDLSCCKISIAHVHVGLQACTRTYVFAGPKTLCIHMGNADVQAP